MLKAGHRGSASASRDHPTPVSLERLKLQTPARAEWVVQITLASGYCVRKLLYDCEMCYSDGLCKHRLNSNVVTAALWLHLANFRRTVARVTDAAIIDHIRPSPHFMQSM